MTNIKEINLNNANAREKVEEVLNEVQKKTSVREISYDDIVHALRVIENNLGVSKKAMNDIRVTCDVNAQSFPNAYKGIPESTWFSARYKNGSWRLTNICRSQTASPTRGHFVYLTDACKKAILDRMECF